MRRMLPAFFCVLLLPNVPAPAAAQEVRARMSAVAEAFECMRAERPSAWTIERVQPFVDGEAVLVYVWVSAGRRVKVSIIPHPSEAAAVETIRRFASTVTSKPVRGIGDEAYAWGYGDEIAIRRGSFTAYVSAISDIDRLLPLLDAGEGAKLRRAEQAALNKNFARLMSSFLADPSAACARPDRP